MGHEALSGHTCKSSFQSSFHSTIIDDFDSDHRGVTFDFTLPGSVLRARPPWRFPPPLLADADFVAELKGALDRLKADRLH